jgi:hypothetical protein
MRYHDQDDVIGFCGDYRHPYGCEDATEVEAALTRFRDNQHTMANLAEVFGDEAQANADELFRAKSQDQP